MLNIIKKILLSLVILYAIIGFIVLPLVVKPQIIDIVSQETNAKIEIQNIYFNPFVFNLEISGIKLSSLDDKELLFLKSITLNIEPYSLINKAVHVDSFIVHEPRISLVLDKNKQINFASIVKVKQVKEEIKEDEDSFALEIPRIILDKIAIVNGSVNYEDYSHKSKFDFRIDHLGFELKNIDTKDISTSDAEIRFYTKLADGGFIDLKSEIIGLDPFIVKGRLEYEASKLYTQWRYLQDSLNLEVADGKISLETDYYFNLEKLKETALSNLHVSLTRLRVKPKGGKKDVLTLNALSIENATIKPLVHDIHLEKILLDSLQVEVKRDKDGNIDWLEYAQVTEEIKEKEHKVVEKIKENHNPWKVVVDEVSLEKIGFNFFDNGIKPSVDTKLNKLNIYAQNITLAGEKPFDYQMNLLLNDKLTCSVKGSVIHKVFDIKSYATCKDIDIVHYRPYIDEIARKELKVYDVKLRNLKAGFDANLTAKYVDSNIVVNVGDANLVLDKFSLNQRSTNKRLVDFSSFKVSGVTLDTATKEVGVKDISLNYLNIRTARLKDGSISVQDLVVPREKKSTKAKKAKIKTKTKVKAKKEKDYRIRLKKFALRGAKIGFEDKMLSPSVKSKIDKIYLSAYNIDSQKNSWMKYNFSARINEGGKVKSKGGLRHTPLKQKGSFDIEKISLKEITPYLQETTYVTLSDGYVSLKTKTLYEPSKTKPDVSVDGSFKIEEFFVHDSRDNSSLISFSEVDLKSFTLELSPNRLFVDEVDVNAFYVNAMVDANKTMNFATLMKVSEDANVTEPELVVEDTNETKSEPFPVKIMKINVAMGSAEFSDASLPIPFKTSIHDLNGVIYSVSTIPNETSYIDILGEVDKYGSTKLKGSLNSSNPKAYTDIDFNFRNLDLSAMSGYSSTFAGYKIEDGKLFLNLNYDIKESEMAGENSIIIKKIKLGEEVGTEDGSSLPLGFVIALLEDSDGVIDIDMPIRGNVDEPDFKYGALVWKTFGNLMLKAVTSPFRFLGSMMGVDGDDLEYAEFNAGVNSILPSEREKLDSVSKLLIKRPKISLSISGSYNLEIDKQAMQKQKLVNLVVKLSDAKNEEEKINAMTIDLLEDIYNDASDDDKMGKLQEKLEKKYEGEAYERAYLQGLVQLCSDAQEITLVDVQNLAKRRSLAIKTYLTDTKGIDPKRVNELDVSIGEMGDNKLVRSKLEVGVK